MARKKQADRKATESSIPRDVKRSPRRRSSRASGDLVDHCLMKALSKPLRAQILAILTERIASPKELSDELEEALGTISYHVGILKGCRVIKLDHKVPRRGAVEHFYRAVAPTLIPPGAWNGLPPAMRKTVSLCILQEFFEDAQASMEVGIFDAPSGELSWTPLIVDTSAVKELEQLGDGFLEAVARVQIKASKRLRKGAGKESAEPISVTMFLARFLSARSPDEGKKASATKRV